jgi:hypothetical protein
MGCTSSKPKRTTSIEDVAEKAKEPVTQRDKNGQINKATPDKSKVALDSNGSKDVSNSIQIPGTHKSFLAPDGIPFIDEDVESEVEEKVQPDNHSKAQQADQNKNVVVNVHKDVTTPTPKPQQSVETTHSSALPANSQKQSSSSTEKKESEVRVEESHDGSHKPVQSTVTVTKVTNVVDSHAGDDVKSSSPDVKKTDKEQVAATLIQAGIRGFLDRKKVKAIKAEKQHPSVSVVKDDQHEHKEKIKLHREEQIEEDVTDGSPHQVKLMDEEHAATMIQASFRGHYTRKNLKSK